MRADIKSKILETAKQLFNERGFNEVSLADIAGVLGISKGNLAYHFKKKEEIVEAILAEIPDDPFPTTPGDLQELNEFFLHIQTVVQEYAFYFWHYTQLAQVSIEIHEKQRAIYQNNANKLLQTLEALLATGMIRQAEYPEEYRRLVDTLLLSNVFWLPFCNLKQEPVSDLRFQRQAWSILYPVLTEQGKRELQNISADPKDRE